MLISLIWAMSLNRVIGKDGSLPWHLPDELAYFRQTTSGKPVIMGRKTFDSVGRKALPKRKNIVISRGEIVEPDVEHTRSIEEAFDLARKTRADECFVLGGSDTYRLSLPFADRLYQTIVHGQVDGDILFPEYDLSNWQVISSKFHPVDDRHAYGFEMQVLERKPAAS